MAISDLIAQFDAEIAKLDAEITKLKYAKSLLSEASETAPASPVVKSGRGRPKGSKNAAKSSEPTTEAKTVAKKATKRVLSPEGRKAIADAMKRRWEERRQAAAK